MQVKVKPEKTAPIEYTTAEATPITWDPSVVRTGDWVAFRDDEGRRYVVDCITLDALRGRY